MAQLSQAYLEWEQRTEQRGLQRGLEQGLKHERSLILRLLNQRVGVLLAATIAQIESLSITQLEALGEALLAFTQVQEVGDWLATHDGEAK
jgi:predicted transposase YdaD